MSGSDTFSDEQIRLVSWAPIFCFGGNVLAFGISMTAILKFTRPSMRDMKWHLINIAVMVFISDLLMDLLVAPTPVYPHIGAASLSWLGGWLLRHYGDAVTAFILMSLQMSFLGASATAVCNATLHRYYVTRNMGNQRMPKLLVAFMVFWQCGYAPLMGITFANFDPMPEYARRLYEEQYPDLLARLSQRPHLIVLNLVRTLSENPFFATGVALLALMVAYCLAGTATYAWLSWRLLNGMQLSERALRMRRQLLISMVLQSFLPLLAYGFGLMIIIIVLYFQPNRSTPLLIVCYLIFGMHSAINCSAMCFSILPYRRGLIQMIRKPIAKVTKSTSIG